MSEPGLQLSVATPERVVVSLPIAGVGFRAMAYLIDLALLFFVSVIAYFIWSLLIVDVLSTLQGMSGVARAIGGLVFFVVIWGYWTGMELAWRGQTLGKRVLRIRVVKADGSPIGAYESAMRNLLRIVDFMPFCYPIGLISMLVDPQHRRLGDRVAGTVLVREEQIDLSRYSLAEPVAEAQVSHHALLTPAQLEIATSLLSRWDQLVPPARIRLATAWLKHAGVALADTPEAALKSLIEARVKDG